eukprot:11022688-Alexandrium_andersonii.AAC.1
MGDSETKRTVRPTPWSPRLSCPVPERPVLCRGCSRVASSAGRQCEDQMVCLSFCGAGDLALTPPLQSPK